MMASLRAKSQASKLKGTVSYFMHFLFLYNIFLFRFSLINTHKLHFLPSSVFKRQQMRGQITAIPTVTSHLDFCILHALNILYTK